MAKGTRITMTKSEYESPIGEELINLILGMCHDGDLDIAEVEALHIFLRKNETSPIAAIGFLRRLTREAVADGAIDELEAYNLKKAMERVVPKEVRSVVSTHLQSIGLPISFGAETSAWTRHEATAKQIEYIFALGGTPTPRMTKGEASVLIDQLLDRRPPTPRQQMLIRFFDRLDLANATKDEVSAWIDELFCNDHRSEMAWDRFKRETNHDPFCQDPSVVPIGAFRQYMARRDSVPSAKASARKGCLPVIIVAGTLVVALGVGLVRLNLG